MKQNLLKSLLASMFLLGSTSVSAYDFEVDGVYYDVISLSEFTCKIIHCDDGWYKGDFVIPETVNYSNKTLNVIEIGDYAFYGCEELTSISIPNSIKKIGNDAFNSCTSITSIIIPNSVTEIGNSVFRDCHELTSVTIPNSVIKIGDNAFEKCNELTSMVIPNSVTYIGYGAFASCLRLTDVTLSNAITEIKGSMFSDCTSLASITIPDSVKDIEGWVFYNCSALTNVTIPNSVKTIGTCIFENCTALTNVTIGSSVRTIDDGVFKGCTALTSLYSLATTPPSIWDSNDIFTNNHYMTVNVYVPQEALEAYKAADVWKNFWNLQSFDPTGMENIKSNDNNENNVYYDLRGNRLDSPKQGLNIINGKKVIMK